jgi:DNA-binding response OmpR family regulator
MSERILFLDDDEQLTRGFKEYLSEQGYEVDCAQEAEEAEALLAHFPYSVVVTDLRLSKLGFGGLEFVKHVRELSRRTRVIVLTGYSWPEIEAEALSHQIDAFVRKPTRMHDLSETIAMVIGGQA